jgi:hypothetical protein
MLILILLCSKLQAQTLEVTATVDKNPVMADESFILSVVANGDVPRDAFDPSILMKDFVVGRTSVSSQTQMVNFNTTKSITWSTVLIPTIKGRYTIPSFNVAGAVTKPIEVLVVPVSAAASSQGRDLFITTSLDVEQAYLQQQIRYTVKLHLGKDLQRGSLSTPTLENADIRQIGKDKEYDEIVEGRRYRIIERTFAIIPQQSGAFTINGPLFEGEVIDNSRQSFGFFNRSKAINRVGPNQNITVLPIPSNYKHHWLPSDFVQLDDEWQSNTGGFVVGEPITRTITLTAVGVVEEQLPEITSNYPNYVKTYPDQAETATVEKDNTLIAQRKESIAIIPSKSGELVLPEVTIPWFNTLTQQTEFAVLAKKTLQIQPAIEQANQPVAPLELEPNQSLDDKPTNTTQNVTDIQSSAPAYWLWILLGVIVLWVFTLILWWLHVKSLTSKGHEKHHSVVRNNQSEQSTWQALDKALNQNDAAKTQQYLGIWLAIMIKDRQASLATCLKKIDHQPLTTLTNTLLASRYAKGEVQWQASELLHVLRKLRKEGTTSNQTKNELSSLYPTF